MPSSSSPSTPPPHPESDRLLRAIRRCSRFDSPWIGLAYRASAVRWANRHDLLSGEGSRTWGGRWNPPGLFRTVYLSLDLGTAEAEYFAQNRRQGLPDSEGLPFVKTGAAVQLSRHLDLTDANIRKKLGLSKTRIVGEPHGLDRESITQALGRIAHSECYQGLVVPSAAAPRGRNLVLFPEKLGPDQLVPLHPDDLPAKRFEP